MRRFISRHLDDVLIVSGAGLIVFGAYLLSVVAAVFTAGAFMIVFGVLIGLGSARKGDQQ
jgi:uncharacterized membrane protein